VEKVNQLRLFNVSAKIERKLNRTPPVGWLAGWLAGWRSENHKNAQRSLNVRSSPPAFDFKDEQIAIKYTFRHIPPYMATVA